MQLAQHITDDGPFFIAVLGLHIGQRQMQGTILLFGERNMAKETGVARQPLWLFGDVVEQSCHYIGNGSADMPGCGSTYCKATMT